MLQSFGPQPKPRILSNRGSSQTLPAGAPFHHLPRIQEERRSVIILGVQLSYHVLKTAGCRAGISSPVQAQVSSGPHPYPPNTLGFLDTMFWFFSYTTGSFCFLPLRSSFFAQLLNSKGLILVSLFFSVSFYRQSHLFPWFNKPPK